MKKALEILKILRDDYIHGELDKDINEAIAELQEAMKPKTCKGCVREAEDMQDPHCVFCSRSCDDNFETKDNA